MNGSLAYLVTGAGCLMCAAGVVIAVVAVSASRRARTPRPGAPGPGVVRPGVDPFRTVDDDADALRGDPRRLNPGDVVEIRGVSYGVRGTVRYAEGGWSWAEHLLDDASGGLRWLSVESDPDLELVLWTALPQALLTPGPPTLDLDGLRWTSQEAGQARFTSAGSTGLDPAGTMRYHDYRGPAGARLSFESYGGAHRAGVVWGPPPGQPPTAPAGADTDWEVSRGEGLHRAEVTIYPQAPAAG